MSRRFLEFLYWGAFALLFIPLILLWKSENKLAENVSVDLSKQDWEAFNFGESSPFFVGRIPKDLKFVEGRKGNEYVIQTNVDVSALRAIEEPVLVLGRIADSDRVLLGECKLGETGFKRHSNEQDRWFWSEMRTYHLPETCKASLTSDSEILSVFIQHRSTHIPSMARMLSYDTRHPFMNGRILIRA